VTRSCATGCSTRHACGLDRLKEIGESELFARRHAGYFRDLFERAETEWETRPAAEWLTAYGRQIDNVRTRSVGHFRRAETQCSASH
jgi:predicted ATPase